MRLTGATRKGAFVSKIEETVTHQLNKKQADGSSRETSETVIQSNNSDFYATNSLAEEPRVAGCFVGRWDVASCPPSVPQGTVRPALLCSRLQHFSVSCGRWLVVCGRVCWPWEPSRHEGRKEAGGFFLWLPPSGDIPGRRCPPAPAQCPRGVSCCAHSSIFEGPRKARLPPAWKPLWSVWFLTPSTPPCKWSLYSTPSKWS